MGTRLKVIKKRAAKVRWCGGLQTYTVKKWVTIRRECCSSYSIYDRNRSTAGYTVVEREREREKTWERGFFGYDSIIQTRKVP